MAPVQTGVAGGDFLQRLQAVGGEARRDDVDIAQLRPLRRETAPDLRPGGRDRGVRAARGLKRLGRIARFAVDVIVRSRGPRQRFLVAPPITATQ
jgi:hypothetical protein